MEEVFFFEESRGLNVESRLKDLRKMKMIWNKQKWSQKKVRGWWRFREEKLRNCKKIGSNPSLFDGFL